MPVRLYCFHPGNGLVRTVPLYDQGSVDHAEAWVRSYNAEEKTSLIRAVLGQNELTVLRADESIRIPGLDYAKPTGGRKR